jgi:hypothetical protein
MRQQRFCMICFDLTGQSVELVRVECCDTLRLCSVEHTLLAGSSELLFVELLLLRLLLLVRRLLFHDVVSRLLVIA